ncbi:unnamed protein product, partial [marine sediment metagenome]
MIELKNLKKLRERAGLNQTELAAKLGVDADSPLYSKSCSRPNTTF